MIDKNVKIKLILVIVFSIVALAIYYFKKDDLKTKKAGFSFSV